MENKTKIIIALIIIVIITFAGICIIKNVNKNSKKHEKNNSYDEILDMKEDSNDSVKLQEANVVEDVTKKSKNVEIPAPNNTSNESIGKEEQESTEAVKEEDKKQKAIELAKNEWEIAVDSYEFEANLQDDGTYEVKVRNKSNTRIDMIYIVNVDNGMVKEK